MIRFSGAALFALAIAIPALPAAAQTSAQQPYYRSAPQAGPGTEDDRMMYRPPAAGTQVDSQPLPPPGVAGQQPSGAYGHQFGPQQGPTSIMAPEPGVNPNVPQQANEPGVVRPPAAVGNLPPAPGAPAAGPQAVPSTATAALPPEDQPEQGPPQELPPNLKRQLVDYDTKEPAGTMIVDTANTYLYLVLGHGKALRYGIGVGREGFTWTGNERISRMKEWPDWFPPAEMIERQPYLPRMMAGGPGNPLGARALYLGKTLYRIHGTNQPSTIGKTVSSGCIRLLNEDIEDLYSRVQVGTRVVVLPGQPQQPEHTAAVAAPAAGNALPPAPQAGPSPTINGLTGQPIPTTR